MTTHEASLKHIARYQKARVDTHRDPPKKTKGTTRTSKALTQALHELVFVQLFKGVHKQECRFLHESAAQFWRRVLPSSV
jgi:hypothetical protein